MKNTTEQKSPSRPAISVIVLNWNGARHLPDCLDALASQSCANHEVIVVDNASSDASEDLVRTRYPAVRWVQTGSNLGFAGGNAVGLEQARGHLVMLLNNDTALVSDCLAQLLACAETHPEVGMVAAHLVDWEGVHTDSAGDGCRVTGRGYARHRGKRADAAPSSGYCLGACAGAVVYRRALLEDVGFLDVDFFLNFEDTDLNVRACLMGWRAWFCREAVVRHRVSASQGGWSAWNVFFGARNHLWVCAKNFPARLIWKYALLNSAEIGVMAWRAAKRGRGRDYMRGIWAGLREWRARREGARAMRERSRLTVEEFDRCLHRPSLLAWWQGRREQEAGR
jgi:GT2 family glycosyltransferase